MRTSLDLDDRRDTVFFDPHHDARESVSGGLRDDRPLTLPAALAPQAADVGEGDEALAAGGSADAEASSGRPAAKGVDRYP